MNSKFIQNDTSVQIKECQMIISNGKAFFGIRLPSFNQLVTTWNY